MRQEGGRVSFSLTLPIACPSHNRLMRLCAVVAVLLLLVSPAACAEDPCSGSVEAACGAALRNQDATRANARVDLVIVGIEKLAADMKQGFSEMKAEMVSMARSIAENARGIAELRSDFHSWTAGPAAKIVMCFGSALAVLLLFMLRNPRKVGEIWAVVTGTAGLQQQVQGAQQEHRP